MTPKLSKEQRQALSEQSSGPVEVQDDQSQRVSVLIDADLHQRAMDALQEQQDVAAIQVSKQRSKGGLFRLRKPIGGFEKSWAFRLANDTPGHHF